MEENSRARPLFVFHRSGASTFSNNNKFKYKYNCSRQNKSFGLTSSSIGIVIYNDIDDINNNDDNNKSNKQFFTTRRKKIRIFYSHIFFVHGRRGVKPWSQRWRWTSR